MRKTFKAVTGARILAQITGGTMTHIVATMDTPDLELELRANGYTWDSVTQCWQWRVQRAFGMKEAQQPLPVVAPRIVCSVRISADSEEEAEASADAVATALELVGSNVKSRSSFRVNSGEMSGRIYLEVEL